MGEQHFFSRVQFALLVLFDSVPGRSFAMADLAAGGPRLDERTQVLIFLVGFAVKTPVFPLHTWLPVVSMEGPASVAALMTGLKLGAYGLLRFAVPLAPHAAQELHWLLAGLGVIGILYVAGLYPAVVLDVTREAGIQWVERLGLSVP